MLWEGRRETWGDMRRYSSLGRRRGLPHQPPHTMYCIYMFVNCISVIQKRFLPMGHFQLLSMILIFWIVVRQTSVGHFQS